MQVLGDFTTGNTALTSSAMVVTALSVVAGPAVGGAIAGMREVLDPHVETVDVDRVLACRFRHPEVHKVGGVLAGLPAQLVALLEVGHSQVRRYVDDLSYSVEVVEILFIPETLAPAQAVQRVQRKAAFPRSDRWFRCCRTCEGKKKTGKAGNFNLLGLNRHDGCQTRPPASAPDDYE